MTHSDFVQALRDAADFFKARPELGTPTTARLEYGFYGHFGPNLDTTVDSKDGLAKFAHIVGGELKKDADDRYYRLIADRGNFSVKAVAYRNDVCERVQVGTKIEPEHVIPAQEEQIVPEREVPVYEWHCPSLLAEAQK